MRPPLPQRITEIILSARGVSLAKTHDGFYLVGLDYLVGHLVVSWDPTTDYFASRDIIEARSVYFQHSGITPPPHSPPEGR